MEVKTCEEYVLAQLEELQEQNDDMRQRLSWHAVDAIKKQLMTCLTCDHYIASVELCHCMYGLQGDVKPMDYCSRYQKREAE